MKRNKENLQDLNERLVLAFLQFRLNRLMHNLVEGKIWHDSRIMWITILRSLEQAYLQGLANIVIKPSKNFPSQISVHTFINNFKSKYPDTIAKLKVVRNKSLSHIDSKKSILKTLGLTPNEMEYLFKEVIDAFQNLSEEFTMPHVGLYLQIQTGYLEMQIRRAITKLSDQ